MSFIVGLTHKEGKRKVIKVNHNSQAMSNQALTKLGHPSVLATDENEGEG